MTQLSVWKVEYKGRWGAANLEQDVTEWLIATDHALLKYKVCKTPGRAKIVLFTDIQAQGRHLDVGSIKRHDYYRRMWRAAGNSPLHTPELQPIRDFQHLLKVSGLEPLIAADEKAKNAWMTAMGHHGEMLLPEIIERAREVTKQQRNEALKQAALTKYADLEGWGEF